MPGLLNRLPTHPVVRIPLWEPCHAVLSTDCLAVGSYEDPITTDSAYLAEEWNGAVWTRVTTPSCGGGTNCYFKSVFCTTGTSCLALAGTGLYSWNGTTWTVEASAPVDVRGISCPKSNFCMGVGTARGPAPTYYNIPVAATWNGAKWNVVSPRTPPSGSEELVGVSCSSSILCTAVGNELNPKTDKEVPVADRWNGTAWALQAMPFPKAYHTIGVTAVKCRGSEPCVAVGSVQHGPGDFPTIKTLAELWNGSSWSLQNSPNP